MPNIENTPIYWIIRVGLKFDSIKFFKSKKYPNQISFKNLSVNQTDNKKNQIFWNGSVRISNISDFIYGPTDQLEMICLFLVVAGGLFITRACENE